MSTKDIPRAVTLDELRRDYIPMKQAAEMLGIRPATMRGWLDTHSEEFHSVRTRSGRIMVRRADVERELSNFGVPLGDEEEAETQEEADGDAPAQEGPEGRKSGTEDATKDEAGPSTPESE